MKLLRSAIRPIQKPFCKRSFRGGKVSGRKTAGTLYHDRCDRSVNRNKTFWELILSVSERKVWIHFFNRAPDRKRCLEHERRMYDEKIRPVMMVLLIAVLASSLQHAAAEIPSSLQLLREHREPLPPTAQRQTRAQPQMKLKIRTPHPGLKQIPPGKGSWTGLQMM